MRYCCFSRAWHSVLSVCSAHGVCLFALIPILLMSRVPGSPLPPVSVAPGAGSPKSQHPGPTDVIPTGRVSFLPKPAQSSIHIPNLADLIARSEDGVQGQFIPCHLVATQFKATALCQHWPSNAAVIKSPAPPARRREASRLLHRPTCKLSSPEPATW